MYEIRRKIIGPAFVYCLTCFTIAELLYFLMLMIEPLAFRLSPRTWVVSFMIVGTMTTLWCSGGLAGLWVLTWFTPARPRDHVKAAILIGAVAAVVFMGFTRGEDHVRLGATCAAGTSIAIAMIVRTYTRVGVGETAGR